MQPQNEHFTEGDGGGRMKTSVPVLEEPEYPDYECHEGRDSSKHDDGPERDGWLIVVAHAGASSVGGPPSVHSRFKFSHSPPPRLSDDCFFRRRHYSHVSRRVVGKPDELFPLPEHATHNPARRLPNGGR